MGTDNKNLSRWNKRGMDEWWCIRADVQLNKGRVSDVFTVDGACRIICMFMEITEAVPATACNMSWIFDSEKGGFRVIADTVDIQSAALGDFVVAECDGTGLIKPTTSTGLVHGYWYETSTTAGTIVTNGGIDIVLGTNNLTAGKGTLYVYYQPLMWNSCIYTGVLHTSTTSSSTSSTTSSSTSTTSSSSSSSSTTSSTN